MGPVMAIKVAMSELEKIRMARSQCNGHRNLAELIRVLGEFAEDRVDEVLLCLEEARCAVEDLILENEELRLEIEALEETEKPA